MICKFFTRTKLFTTLNFIRLKNSDLFTINWIILPLILLPLWFALTFDCWGIDIDLFGEKGLLKSVNGLLNVLVALFIAALTAVSTVDSKELDLPIRGEGITLAVKNCGKNEEHKITRRRFMCMLFGYNSFIGIWIYLMGEFGFLTADIIKNKLAVELHVAVVGLFLLIYLFLTISLFLNTLLGLHFLTNKIEK